ncbi:hypothetical protein HYE67_002328 [Fusarium culmorum]|uniref:Uncharacterized protein n=1 Tax=Fusarium culmorum TaxID=5516 RepID=A0A7S8D1A1_FUSCU|nr:hypothetical protein HYE67_002328 [Fusarium culmorum]
MSKRNLLLCFDAFGTLIRPAKPVAQQYAQVARQCGLTDFSDEELQSTLISTIKQESKKNPNFGKETGLGATRWWTNVIHNTFTPLLKDGQALPQDLAPRLLHRFASREGYETEEGLVDALKGLKSNSSRHYHQLVVGVITNSDDRIPSILSSLGLTVSPLRYGTQSDANQTETNTYDIDFHCMSYDVGVEKPDKRIFNTAEYMLAQIISARSGRSLNESKSEVGTWQKVYVGDDYSKDVVGSTNAGWNPVLLDPKDECDSVADLKRWRSSPDEKSQKKAYWASVSQSDLRGESNIHLAPVFDPTLVDKLAAGDINAQHADKTLKEQAKSLPMHRYDWWAPGSAPPWPFKIPKPFDKPDLESVGNAMPWAEWDITSQISKSVFHFTKEQVATLWKKANEGSQQRLSQHDAVLAHIWSCIARARGLENDKDSFHCDLVYGVRPSFQLDNKFLGSPIVMMNIELPASQVCDRSNSTEVATQVRNTLKTISNPYNLSAHLHALTYEKSPQRIWQAFLGRRHVLVTTWARAGVYGIDFGLGSNCVYAEGVVPEMDGIVLIKEAPGPLSKHWTDNGVDISVYIRADDMDRLVRDPVLFPTTMSDEKETR